MWFPGYSRPSCRGLLCVPDSITPWPDTNPPLLCLTLLLTVTSVTSICDTKVRGQFACYASCATNRFLLRRMTVRGCQSAGAEVINCPMGGSSGVTAACRVLYGTVAPGRTARPLLRLKLQWSLLSREHAGTALALLSAGEGGLIRVAVVLRSVGKWQLLLPVGAPMPRWLASHRRR